MTSGSLGKLERIELRNAWEHEALDFTPWLAQDENIRLLSETIGLPELQVEDTEVNVGPFRADILCTTLGDDGYVLIENQLERTDHRHLGQVMTYAAGLDAAKVVWISPEFTEEHRAALDWLNGITSEEFLFFGVQIELWRIDDSPMAPRFNVVVKPNEWAKQARSAARSATSADRQVRNEAMTQWWAGLLTYLEANNRPFTLQVSEPSPRNWAYVAHSCPGLRVTVSHAIKGGSTKAYFIFGDRQSTDSKQTARWWRFAFNRRDRLTPPADGRLDWVDNDESGYGRMERLDDGDPESGYAWLASAVPQMVQAILDLRMQFEGSTNPPEGA